MKLKLRREDLKAIDEHAFKNLPHECCGLMIGKSSSYALEVVEVIQAENLLGSSVAFEADAEIVFKAIDRAEKKKLELVGIYHSHPNVPAYVSARDAEIMKLWPGVAWLIISVTKDRIIERKSYAMDNREIEELEIEII